MLGLKNLSIDFLTGVPYLVWPALLLLIAVAFFTYKRTNPPIPTYLKIILAGLRIIAVIAVLVALAEPVVSYGREYNRQKRLTLLLDRSTSMSKVEQGKSRAVRLDSLLSTDNFDRILSQTDPKTYFFGGNMTPDQSGVEADRTAIGEVLHQIGKQQLAQKTDYLLLFSDGRSNSGKEPTEIARQLEVPIITVDLSAGGGSFDVGLEEVDYNPVLFVGRQTEIKVKLSWHHLDSRTITVQLLDSNKVLTQQRLALEQEDGLAEVTIKYTPTAPGQKILKVVIPRPAEEESGGNNERSFSVNVLKSRLKVLLVASHPDNEIGFLKRFLGASDKYEVDLILTGPKGGNLSGRFPSTQAALNRYDLIILYDPDPLSLDSRQQIIKSYLADKGGAVWVLLGQRFAERGPVEWFNNLLPFHQSSARAMELLEYQGEPVEGHLFHPTIRLADNQGGIRQVWADLPPFQTLVRCDLVNPEAIVTAWAALPAKKGQRPPVIGYRRFGPGKLMASTALPFWHWGFVNLGFGEDDSHYGRFLEGLTTWLTVRDDFDPVRVIPEREVYHRGETVRFDGFAFDLGFRPIPGVSGTVRLENLADSTKHPAETDLLSIGEGRFAAELKNLSPGDYQWTAVMEKEGRRLKEDRGLILVEQFSLEEFNQSGDPAALMALANLSGGSYFTFDRFKEALDAIDLTEVTVEVNRDVTLFDKYWMLLLMIGALSAEWLLRKVNQLI